MEYFSFRSISAVAAATRIVRVCQYYPDTDNSSEGLEFSKRVAEMDPPSQNPDRSRSRDSGMRIKCDHCHSHNRKLSYRERFFMYWLLFVLRFLRKAAKDGSIRTLRRRRPSGNSNAPGSLLLLIVSGKVAIVAIFMFSWFRMITCH